MTEPKRIGILTGGGDCPGLNAVIRGVVKCAVHQYQLECVGILDSFDGLIHGPATLPLSWHNVKGLLFRGGTILGSTNKGDPFAYKESVNGKIVTRNYSDAVIENMEKLGLDGLIVIGGDGTMAITNKFVQQKKIRVVGVPKTIDNDIYGTDETFGFNTSVSIVTDALDRLQTTAASHHRVMILETMGRNAGWIALEAGIAGGADVILIPEIPFRIDPIVNTIEARETKGRRFTIICVSEGAAVDGGEQVIQDYVADSAEPVRLGGIAEWLAEQLKKRIKSEVRYTVLGHIQRGGIPSAYDRVLCTRLGTHAVHAFMDGNHSNMVAIHNNKVTLFPIADVAGKNRLVDPDGDTVRAARDTGVSFGDEDGEEFLG